MRGQITVSTTWIFALIAGIAVFSLIINVALQQRSTARNVQANTLLTHVKTQLHTATTTGNTYSTINMPKSTLTFTCNGPQAWKTSKIRMSDAQSIANTRYQPIFAPTTVTGKQLNVWSQHWNMPYPVTTMLYVTTPNTYFIIDNTTVNPVAKQFINDLPKQFNYDIENNAVTEHTGYDTYRYVFFNRNNLPSVDGHVINVHGSINEGTVTINDTTTSTSATTVPYTGKALLYGAIFSADPIHYSCNKRKATRHLQHLANINRNRTREILTNLTQRATNPNQCNGWRTDNNVPVPPCNECIHPLHALLTNYTKLTTTTNANTLRTVRNNITTITQRLERASCPEV